MSTINEPHSNDYNPPQYLLAGTGLSRDELVTQYQEFRLGLRLVESAPELVFERLVGNLMGTFSATLSRERAQHATAREAWDREKAALQSDHQRAKASALTTEIVRLPSPKLSIAPSLVTSNQTYLQFWFLSSTHVRVATTNTPFPYGTASGWTKIDHIASSGSYDSRMDAMITTPTLPNKLTHTVRFAAPFAAPPQIAVWLTGLSAVTGAEVKVTAAADKITETGFELLISSGDGTPIESVGAAWAVFEKLGDGKKPVVKVGSFSSRGRSRAVTLKVNWKISTNDGPNEAGLAAICAVDLKMEGGVWVELELRMARDSWTVSLIPFSRFTAGPENATVYSIGVGYVLLKDVAF